MGTHAHRYPGACWVVHWQDVALRNAVSRAESPKRKVDEVDVRKRFWVETALGLVTACLAVLTLVNHEWLEPFIGRDVDEGSGSLEVVIVAAFTIVTIALALTAWAEFRRPRPAPEV